MFKTDLNFKFKSTKLMQEYDDNYYFVLEIFFSKLYLWKINAFFKKQF